MSGRWQVDEFRKTVEFWPNICSLQFLSAQRFFSIWLCIADASEQSQQSTAIVENYDLCPTITSVLVLPFTFSFSAPQFYFPRRCCYRTLMSQISAWRLTLILFCAIHLKTSIVSLECFVCNQMPQDNLLNTIFCIVGTHYIVNLFFVWHDRTDRCFWA